MSSNDCLNFFGACFPVLVDTGSQITAVSESFAKYLSLHGRYEELPVSNIELFTAIERKSMVIKKQISVQLRRK